MTTANSIIERALVKARVIGPGEPVPANKANQILEDLNDLLESWSLEGLMIPCDVLELFTLTVGKGEYTFGSGGDLDSARPMVIKDETYARVGSSDYPVKLYPMSLYRSIANKAASGIPRVMAYLDDYPLGKLFLWPLPSSDQSYIITLSGQVIYTGPGNYFAYTGTDTFGGPTGVIVDVGTTLEDADYRVIIQPLGVDPVDIGAISVSNKTVTSFTVYNTGSDTTSTFDWVILTDAQGETEGETVSSGIDLFIRSSKELDSFSTLTSEVTLHPGYSRAIISNLALEISPNFGKKVNQALAVAAASSKSNIKSSHSKPRRLAANPEFAHMFGSSGFDIVNWR